MLRPDQELVVADDDCCDASSKQQLQQLGSIEERGRQGPPNEADSRGARVDLLLPVFVVVERMGSVYIVDRVPAQQHALTPRHTSEQPNNNPRIDRPNQSRPTARPINRNKC